MMAKLDFRQQCKQNQESAVEALLSTHPPIDAVNHDGYAPPHIAISRDSYVTIIEELSAAGANTNAVNNDGETRLHQAVQENQESVIEELLTTRPPIDAINHDGYAPPHIAVQDNYVTIIEKSSAAGANTNAVNNDSETRLREAVQAKPRIGC